MRTFAEADVPHDEVRAKQYQCRAPFNRADVVRVRRPRYRAGEWHAPQFRPVEWAYYTALAVDGQIIALVMRNANYTLHWSRMTADVVVRDGYEIVAVEAP